jgi:hypothetical protein
VTLPKEILSRLDPCTILQAVFAAAQQMSKKDWPGRVPLLAINNNEIRAFS